MDKKYIIIIAILAIINVAFISLIVYGRLTASKEIGPTDSVTQELENFLSLDSDSSTLPVPVNQETELSANCDAFPDMLSSCKKYKCQFIHPLTGENMKREILGIIDGKCVYLEEMPNGGQMECKYTESFGKVIAQYYRDSFAAESMEFSININLGSGELTSTYIIDGKEVENPLQEALDSGVCVVSGY